jgi:type I restriction enzyme S subunit
MWKSIALSKGLVLMFDQVSLDTLFSIPQRNGLTKPKRLRGEGVKMVNMGELFSERRIQDMTMDRVPCSERELESNKLEEGDLLFARQSLTLEGAGQSSIFLGDQEDVVFESHLIRCRLDKSKVDFYFFESKFGKQRIGSIVEQVAAAGIRGSDLIKLPVFLPTLSEQKSIAHILGTLDDKIELNQKMNQTLEETAKAIFKSWFVDFDPVRAKAEGHPTSLPPEISDLFPDELIESDIGEVPKGWKNKALGDQITLIKGRSYKSAELIDSDTALVTLKSFHRGGGYRFDGLKSYAGAFKPEQVVHEGDLIIALTDVTQAADVIGKPAIVRSSNQYRQLVASLDVGIIKVKDHSTFTKEFCYFLMLSSRYTQHSLGYTSGTTVLHLAKDATANFEVSMPPTKLIDAFTEISSNIMQRIFAAEKENQTLSDLRDTLLPKLISGELRIPDAEKFLEEAGI